MSILISRALPFFQFSWLAQHPCWPSSVTTSCAYGNAAGALPSILRNINVASKYEYHETSPRRLFLTLPSLPFVTLTAIFVVVCNMQLILFLFQLAILGLPVPPFFFFFSFLYQKRKCNLKGGKKWVDKKNSAWHYLLPGCSHETAAEGGHHHVLINNLHAFQLFDNCSWACRSNRGDGFFLSNFHT